MVNDFLMIFDLVKLKSFLNERVMWAQQNGKQFRVIREQYIIFLNFLDT